MMMVLVDFVEVEALEADLFEQFTYSIRRLDSWVDWIYTYLHKGTLVWLQV